MMMKRRILRIVAAVLMILFSYTNLWATAIMSGKCGDNLTLTLDDNGVLTISGTGDMYDYYPKDSPCYDFRLSIRKVSISYGVTSIGNSMFYDCSDLTSVTIPNSVTNIGDYAFVYCTSLTNIEIPNSVIGIGLYAFKGCTSLTSVEIPNSVTSIGVGAFYECSSLNNVVIPSSVTSIGDYAFYECHKMTSVTFNAEKCVEMGVVSTPVFWGCSSLKTITIGEKVTMIPNYAFMDCHGLTSIEIPNSVIGIGSYAFYDCSGLTSVEIGNNVDSIGSWAFDGCSGLTKISVSAMTPPTCGDGVFSGVNKQMCELEVPQESLEAYKSADTWKDFYNITTGIGDVRADKVKVSVANGEIFINGVADDAEVEIYGANGAMIYRGANKTIAVPSPGIYILRVVGKTIKVAL